MRGMKPGFALSLSQDGILLLQRADHGFVRLGAADPEDPALFARLAELRAVAADQAPAGFATKLVLPESQILYTEIEAPGPDRATRRAAIAKALEGRTPYAVKDLVFDWSGTGARVQVAVVARITLDEAESFAEDHRFHPVSFVAVPPPGRFGGEPFFGLTSRAAEHLPAGTRLDRDQDPVAIIEGPAAPDPGADAKSGAEASAEVGAHARVQAPAPAPPEHTVAAEEPADEAPFVALDADEAPPADAAAGALPDEAAADADAAHSGATADASDPDKAAQDAPADGRPEPPVADTAASDDSDPSDNGRLAQEQRQDAAVAFANNPVAEDAAPGAPTAETSAANTAEPVAPDLREPDVLRAVIEDVAGARNVAAPADGPAAAPFVSRRAARRAARRVQVDTDDAASAAAEAGPAPVVATATPAADLPAADLPAPAPSQTAATALLTPADTDPPGAVPPPRLGAATDGLAGAQRPLAVPLIDPMPVTAALVPPLAAPEAIRPVPERPRPPKPRLPGAGKRQRSILSRVLSRTGKIDAATGALPPKALRRQPRSPEEEARTLARPGQRSAATRNSARMGLMLTVALVLAMGTVALWSNLSGTTGATDSTATQEPMAGAPQAGTGTEQVAAAPGIAAPDPLPANQIAGTDAAAIAPPAEVPAAAPSDLADQPAVAETPAPQDSETTALAASDPAPVPGDTTLSSSGQAPGAPLAEAGGPTAPTTAAAASGAAASGTAAAPAAPDPVPETLAAYRAEGLWQAAPALAGGAEPDAARTPLPLPPDPDPAFGGAGTLTDAAALAGDRTPGTQALPIPFARAPRFDAAGRLTPTPEGIEAPGGFTLIAGTPRLVPPARPADLVPAAVPPPAGLDAAGAAPEAAAAEAAAALPAAVPALPATRPVPRPARPEDDAALAPAAAAPSVAEAAALPPPVDPAHAALKPRTRSPAVAAAAAAAATVPAAAPIPPATLPASPVQPAIALSPAPAPPVDPSHAALKPRLRSAAAAAAAAQRDTTADAVAAAAAAALSAETAAATAPGVATASRLAVASSRRPASKPSTFAASVEAALALAVATPVAAAAPEPAALPAPDPEAAAEAEASDGADPVAQAEIDEPEVDSVAPDIPTRANVAKQATIRNALDMGDVSLIGVYGSSQNRRALVRMESGRFVKVEVGDRLDGGRVQAIGETQLTYVKNGRSIVLKMIRDS
jgi:hypothetical protein